MAQQQFNPTPGVSTNADCEAVINANATDAEGRLSAIEAASPQIVTYTLSNPSGIDLVGFTDLFGAMTPLSGGAPGPRQCMVSWTLELFNTAAAAPNPGDFADSYIAGGLATSLGGPGYSFGNRFVKGNGQTGATTATGFKVITVNPGETFNFFAASQAGAAAPSGGDVLKAVSSGPDPDGSKINFFLI